MENRRSLASPLSHGFVLHFFPESRILDRDESGEDTEETTYVRGDEGTDGRGNEIIRTGIAAAVSYEVKLLIIRHYSLMFIARCRCCK